jgi:hypothetical protein
MLFKTPCRAAPPSPNGSAVAGMAVMPKTNVSSKMRFIVYFSFDVMSV